MTCSITDLRCKQRTKKRLYEWDTSSSAAPAHCFKVPLSNFLQFVVYQPSSLHGASLWFHIWFPISPKYLPAKQILTVSIRLFCSCYTFFTPNRSSEDPIPIYDNTVNWHKDLPLHHCLSGSRHSHREEGAASALNCPAQTLRFIGTSVVFPINLFPTKIFRSTLPLCCRYSLSLHRLLNL